MDAETTANFKGRDFQFLLFGARRRMCPKMACRMDTVEIMLTNLVYHFKWQLPNRMRAEDVDMIGVFGVTLRLKQILLLSRSTDLGAPGDHR